MQSQASSSRTRFTHNRSQPSTILCYSFPPPPFKNKIWGTRESGGHGQLRGPGEPENPVHTQGVATTYSSTFHVARTHNKINRCNAKKAVRKSGSDTRCRNRLQIDSSFGRPRTYKLNAKSVMQKQAVRGTQGTRRSQGIQGTRGT